MRKLLQKFVQEGTKMKIFLFLPTSIWLFRFRELTVTSLFAINSMAKHDTPSGMAVQTRLFLSGSLSFPNPNSGDAQAISTLIDIHSRTVWRPLISPGSSFIFANCHSFIEMKLPLSSRWPVWWQPRHLIWDREKAQGIGNPSQPSED